MVISWATPAYPFKQYDGTNAEELCELVRTYDPDPDASVSVAPNTQNDKTLAIYRYSDNDGAIWYTMNNGDWMSPLRGVVSDADWQQQYIVK